MGSSRRRNQAAKGTAARGGEFPEEQPSANRPPQRQQDEVKIFDPAMSEQRMVTIQDEMNDLKEMVKRQAEEIERMNREPEALQKQQQEFQKIHINLGLGQHTSRQ